jgi:hypothetical protein
LNAQNLARGFRSSTSCSTAEQVRIMQVLVERVEVGPAWADIRLPVEGLASMVRDLAAIGPESRIAA